MAQSMKEFEMKKGIKQGDPLSPVLFICAAEGSNWLFKEAMDMNLIKGARSGHKGLTLSHLQFADDKVLFSEADVEEKKRKRFDCFDGKKRKCCSFGGVLTSGWLQLGGAAQKGKARRGQGDRAKSCLVLKKAKEK
ncbi:uncharacterized protein LOC130757440 [Actinidia eriantha]|uniref:uncharacterized protein LOC130757440 n=1 Tax=Actinidia eriantha TaxID=165200 RepID=UPI002584A1CF|nr:uncharacterized protein LOC130757440 [Actinidia eriantha]